MGRPVGFDQLWARLEEAQKVGRDINPDGNRCAVVLGLVLKSAYQPRKASDETSFRDISQPPEGIRGRPFLDRFYVKAEDMAKRLRDEWGAPNFIAEGSTAMKTVSGRRGVIFVKDAWRTLHGLGPKTVDHVDLWNGERMGAYSAEKSKESLGACGQSVALDRPLRLGTTR